MRLVIGAGADATRAAACLAATGQAVLLLQGCDSACGLSHPTLPEGTGQIRVPGGMQSTIESVTRTADQQGHDPSVWLHGATRHRSRWD